MPDNWVDLTKLSRRLDHGCTDTRIFRGNGFWEIIFTNAGIPSSDPLAVQRYRASTLARALQLAVADVEAPTLR